MKTQDKKEQELFAGFDQLMAEGRPQNPADWASLVTKRGAVLARYMDTFPTTSLGTFPCLHGDVGFGWNLNERPLDLDITGKLRAFGLKAQGIWGILERVVEIDLLDTRYDSRTGVIGHTTLWNLTRKNEWIKVYIKWKRAGKSKPYKYETGTWDEPKRLVGSSLLDLSSLTNEQLSGIWDELEEEVLGWNNWASGLAGVTSRLTEMINLEKLMFMRACNNQNLASASK